MSGVRWTGRLVKVKPEDEAEFGRGYSGVVSIAGFPYRINVQRDWSSDAVVLQATVTIDTTGKKAR